MIVPASFTFPHSGKLLSISFILFAGWFADAIVPTAQYLQLALAGLVTFFGSLNAAVPFLLNLFRIPADTFQLFLATGVVLSRFGTLLAAVHTVAVALLGTCAMVGALKWHRGRVVRYALTTLVMTVAVLGGARTLFGSVLPPEYRKDQVLAQMHLSNNRRRPSWSIALCQVRESLRPARCSRGFGKAAPCGSVISLIPCRLRLSTSAATLWIRHRARASARFRGRRAAGADAGAARRA